jgi:hypothetical protein
MQGGDEGLHTMVRGVCLLLCERVEGVAKGEIVEITNVHAGAVHIVEMIVG